MSSLFTELMPGGFGAVVYPLVLKFVSAGRLGDEAGASALRDGIGRGLNRLSECAGAGEDCCPYCSYFKPMTPIGAGGGVAPGFVIEAPGFPKSPEGGQVARGNLVLLGRAEEALPWFVAAALHCGQVGVGSPRARFSVDRGGRVKTYATRDILRVAGKYEGVTQCKIDLCSPFVLEADGKPLEELSFPRLIKAICERLQPNVAHWCGGVLRNKERDALVKPLIDQAATLDWEFRKGVAVQEFAKKSDGRRNSLLGFTGELIVRGDLEPFWPLLVAGSIAHFGQFPHLDRGRFEFGT